MSARSFTRTRHERPATLPVPIAVGVSGTADLGAAVLEAAAGGSAVVIRDHGPVCFGSDLAEALAHAFALEERADPVTLGPLC
jgi:ribulose-5-phosphate 4-epimerase/fuculose-1-phosphate aldolase